MTTTLLLIDLQRNMLEPPDPVPAAARLIEAGDRLLDRAREQGARVVHVRNNGPAGDPDEPGTPGWQLYHRVADGETVLDKHSADAFADTALAELVPAGTEITVAGLASDFCIEATVLGALGRGYPVRLVRGAHAAYPGAHETADEVAARIERRLADAGATLIELDEADFR